MLNNQKKNLLAENDGFTLIEALTAMFVLVVGILALYAMHITSIRYNATANAMTTSSTWAADRVEQLLALSYDHTELNDDDGNGDAGLNDTSVSPDGQALSPDGKYTVFWNVAEIITPNPTDPTYSTLKAIRVTVQHNDFGTTKQVVLNYYKQKIF